MTALVERLGLQALEMRETIERQAAEIERLEAEIDDVKQVQFPRKVKAVTDGLHGKVERQAAEIERLKDALQDANNLCRSAYSIVNNSRLNTDWPAFRIQLGKSLKRQHQVMYPLMYEDGMSEADDTSLLRQQQDDLMRHDFEKEMKIDAFGSNHE